MKAIVIFFKKLFGIPLTDLERIYDHKGPVLVATPKPAPAPAPAPVESAPAPGRYPDFKAALQGVDVSHYQKGIDWNDVLAHGAKFAFLKASDGASTVDPTFELFRKQTRDLGLISGAYHYFRFEKDPEIQAHNFINALGGNTLRGELPPVLDIEWDKTSKRYGEGKEMDEEAARKCLAWLQIVEQITGMVPIVYTNFYFFQGFENKERFARYLPWVPAYAPSGVALDEFFPKVHVPRPWTRLAFWQYSEKLKMGGVDAVDGNLFFGSAGDLTALTKK